MGYLGQLQNIFAGKGGGRTVVRAKAEVEERSGGEEVRRASNSKQQQQSNNKGQRGKVGQVNLL